MALLIRHALMGKGGVRGNRGSQVSVFGALSTSAPNGMSPIFSKSYRPGEAPRDG